LIYIEKYIINYRTKLPQVDWFK